MTSWEGLQSAGGHNIERALCVCDSAKSDVFVDLMRTILIDAGSWEMPFKRISDAKQYICGVIRPTTRPVSFITVEQ